MLWRTDIGQFVCNRCPHEHIRKNPQKTVLGGARWLAHPILRIPPRPTGEIMLVASSRPRHSSRWLGWAGAPLVLLPQSASCTCTTRRKEHDPDSEKPRCRCRCPSFGTPSCPRAFGTGTGTCRPSHALSSSPPRVTPSSTTGRHTTPLSSAHRQPDSRNETRTCASISRRALLCPVLLLRTSARRSIHSLLPARGADSI
jgi:hypothetical protein